MILTMTRLRLAIVATFVVAPLYCRADPVDVANAIRSQGCGSFADMEEPLRRSNSLGQAAKRVAAGEELLAAAAASGYRAKSSAVIRFTTTGDNIAQMLTARFCDIVANPAFRDIGIYSSSDTTWLLLAAPLTLEAAGDAGSPGQHLLDLINEARARERRCGRSRFQSVPPLTPSPALNKAANAHALDISQRGELSHEGFDGSQPADRATRAGYRWRAIAENVAAGQTTAEAVLETWLQSPGHCANLMDPRYSQSGAAVALNENDAKVVYWVQVYARP
jgi:uncharacterized protein YkwD